MFTQASFPAQVEAGHTLKSVSESLLVAHSEDGQRNQQCKEAATYLFHAVSNVLEATAQNGTEEPSSPDTAQVSNQEIQKK